jgi:G:T/U-mismatch repair DNA glycosylase
MKVREDHPEWYYPIPEMHTLILGTFPPHKKQWDYQFYYPNKANHFWKVMAEVGKTTLTKWEDEPAVEERKHLMKQMRVGVQNIGLAVERTNQSALDKDIVILE